MKTIEAKTSYETSDGKEFKDSRLPRHTRF